MRGCAMRVRRGRNGREPGRAAVSIGDAGPVAGGRFRGAVGGGELGRCERRVAADAARRLVVFAVGFHHHFIRVNQKMGYFFRISFDFKSS